METKGILWSVVFAQFGDSLRKFPSMQLMRHRVFAVTAGLGAHSAPGESYTFLAKTKTGAEKGTVDEEKTTLV